MSTRLLRIRDKLHYALEPKTSWGRNELKELINTTLLEIADEEYEELVHLPETSLSEEDLPF